MSEFEIDFPRGGVIEPLENTRKPSTKREKPKESETQPKKKRLDPEYENVFTKFFSKELLTKDVRALGIVKKIKETELILETLNGLKVTVDARSISADFTANLGETSLDEIFIVGQALAFKVTQNAKGKNDQPSATIDPAALNCHLVPAAFKNALVINGSVSSIQEKGAIIDIGLTKITGFVKKDDLPPNFKLDKLRAGQVLMFRVRKGNETKAQRVIELSAYTEMDVYSDDKLSLSDLMPGTIVLAEPGKLVSSGVFVNLENENKAYINKSYLPPRIRLDPSRFVKAIRAVVTCILPNSPIFVLSAHPDVVALSKPEKRGLPEEIKPGNKANFTVYDIDRNGNVYYYLGDQEKPLSVTAISMKHHFEDYDNEISKFEIGTTHKCRILSHRTLDRMLLVSSHKDIMKQKVVQLSDIIPGERINVVVSKIIDKGLIVKLGVQEEEGDMLGFIPSMHTSDRQKVNWIKQFEIGQRISCRVLAYNDEKNRLYITAKPSLVNSKLPQITQFTHDLVGKTVIGMAFNPFESGAFLLQFYNNLAGFLPSNEAKKIPDLKEGDVVRVKVASVDMEKRRILLTLREDDEKVQTVEKKLDNKNIVIVKKAAKPFQVCQAQVLGPWYHGKTSPFTTAELRLKGGTIGRLHVSELDLSNCADTETPMVNFLKENTGKFVEVKVICVGNRKSITESGNKALTKKCGTSRFVECTMIKSKIAEPFRKLRLINFETSFERGDKIKVFIGDASKMLGDNAEYANVEINPIFSARIPRIYINLIKNELCSSDVLPITEDSAFKFANGELRHGIVISQERTARSKKVNVALGETIVKEEIKRQKLGKSSKRKRRESQRSDVSEDAEATQQESLVHDPGFDFSLGEFSMMNFAKVGKKSNRNVPEVKDEPEDDDDQSLLQRERKIEEHASKWNEAIVENVEDFDRLLTASPNSSDLWMKYITHFVRIGKVKEAREIAERALSSINFREADQLFNIWTVYLNLEVLFGDAESLKAVFDRAACANDALRTYKQMAKILSHHKRYEQLDELYENMIKKFRHDDLEVWFSYATYLFESERLEEARSLLEKALSSLIRKHHLIIMTRFGQLEYRYGDQQRAKTLFEKVLQTYPKKTDIWNVYVDMSIKHEGIAEAREELRDGIFGILT